MLPAGILMSGCRLELDTDTQLDVDLVIQHVTVLNPDTRLARLGCEITDLGTGETHDIRVGTLYALNHHDRHILRANKGTHMRMVCVFNPPLAIAAGQYGVALRYLPTTNGPNPGPLHCIGLSPNPNTPVSDQFLTFSNDGIQAYNINRTAYIAGNTLIDISDNTSTGDGIVVDGRAWLMEGGRTLRVEVRQLLSD